MASRPRTSLKLRQAVFRRASSRCEYCNCLESLSPSPFDAENVVPISLGGDTAIGNLACACHGCNLYKADHVEGFDPVSKTRVVLFNPRKHTWDDHFVWSPSGLEIMALTPIGRATVNLLSLNRPALKNLRRLMRLTGGAFLD